MTLDKVMRDILNDREIFDFPYDREKKECIIIFDSEEWAELKEKFRNGEESGFHDKINEKLSYFKQQQNKERNQWRLRKLENAVELAKSLQSAWDNKPNLLKNLFDTLDSFGELECHLPNMEDYGRVIENHEYGSVMSYFLDKINSTKRNEEVKALQKLLDYIKHLYDMKLDTLEIAFFVRKLNSLNQYVEVLKDG